MSVRRRQVRCRACGRSVLAGLNVCPHCGRNPAEFHMRWRATLLSLLAGIAAGSALFTSLPGLPRLLALPPEPTPAPAVAAARRPTFTPTLSPTRRPTDTP